MTEPDSRAKPLAALVTARREELGLTKSELARRARITRSTLHEIERGQRHALMPETYSSLDRALEWTPGTLRKRSKAAAAKATVGHSLSGPELLDDVRARMALIGAHADAERFELIVDMWTAVIQRLDELDERVGDAGY